MATFPQASQRRQQINRRQLLQVGGAGLFGLTLPRLLWSQATAGEFAQTATAKSCIFIVVSGGLSHIDTFDPKPHGPEEIRGPYKPISTSVPGVQITHMLPQLAAVADKYCLLRSLSHAEVPHVSAAHMMLTGQMDGSTADDTPFIGSLISKFRPSSASMPSHVWLHNMKTGTNKIPRYDSGLGVIGHEHAALRVGYELDNPTSPDFRVTAFDPGGGISPRQMSQRVALLDQLKSHSESLAAARAAARFETFQQRARDLVAGPAARQAFDLHREPEKTRDRYGRNPLGQYLLMARRLIEAGVRLTTVTAWPGLAPGETKPTVTQVWDMHGDRYKPGDSMFGNGPFGFQWSLPRLDQGVAALLTDLDERGLLDETLVVLVSEFGRTPKMEHEGRGRDHWPQCYSGLLAGGGVRGGSVYGASDAIGAFVAEGRPLSPSDFAATIFQALGIAPETRYGPDGFSLRVSEGEPLREIFG